MDGKVPRTTTIIRLPQVKEKIGLGRSMVFKLAKEGLLPPQIKLSARAVGWVEEELDAVIKARVAGFGADKIRRLVTELVAKRPGSGATVEGAQ